MTINQKSAVHRNMASFDSSEKDVPNEPVNTTGEENPVFDDQIESTTVDEVQSVETLPADK